MRQVPIKTIAIADRTQVLTGCIDDIGVVPWHPSNPISIRVKDKLIATKSDPVSVGIE
jgi:hypothetical protein